MKKIIYLLSAICIIQFLVILKISNDKEGDKGKSETSDTTKLIKNSAKIIVKQKDHQEQLSPNTQTNYLDTAKNKVLPAIPPNDNVIHNWLAKKDLKFNTSAYKAYIFNGMPFRMAYPKNYVKGSGKKYPIVFALHGKGGSGDAYDNESQLFDGGKIHLEAIEDGKFDGFVVFPQIPGTWYEDRFVTLNLLIEALTKSIDIDNNRIVFHGLSYGGNGVIQMASKYPKLIAAILPMSPLGGWGNINDLKHIPIWAFQGKRDRLTNYTYLEYELERLRQNGASVRYSLYADLAHDSWTKAYNEPDFFPFLSKASKSNPIVKNKKTKFAKTENIAVSMSLTPGFDNYEWRKDGVIIKNQHTNILEAKEVGKYDARILNGGNWSIWSLAPIVISSE